MEQNWKTTRSNQHNLLGHRNWIVVTDLAYPLQSNPGNAIIIKTPLTIPYTSVFLELDCAYWDASREKEIRRQ